MWRLEGQGQNHHRTTPDILPEYRPSCLPQQRARTWGASGHGSASAPGDHTKELKASWKRPGYLLKQCFLGIQPVNLVTPLAARWTILPDPRCSWWQWTASASCSPPSPRAHEGPTAARRVSLRRVAQVQSGRLSLSPLRPALPFAAHRLPAFAVLRLCHCTHSDRSPGNPASVLSAGICIAFRLLSPSTTTPCPPPPRRHTHMHWCFPFSSFPNNFW